MEPAALTLFNTLSRTKERFSPLVGSEVRMYVCGPTVYDISHVGHARKEVVFDVIARYFKFCGYSLRYVRNITDIDDKIIIRAQEEGVPWEEIARRYEDAFHNDMDALGILKPDYEPRATETIEEMQELIQILMDKGFAYVSDGSVYFSVADWEDYGKLSHRRLEEMLAGARVEVDASKKNPMDFALWKAVKPGEPSWPSPWGEGRPGWHIECSAMSKKFLGETFDIHGGGVDLVFPHHENEIVQSEAASGKPFCYYWIHNGLLTVRKEKMSKSLGNYITIQEMLKVGHPEAIRMFFLSNHYRSPVDFSEEAMTKTKKNLDYFYNTLLRIQEICGDQEVEKDTDYEKGRWAKTLEGIPPEDQIYLKDLKANFRKDMDDDFNTAEALGKMFRATSVLNRWVDQNDAAARTPAGREVLQAFRRQLKDIGQVLGIFLVPPLQWFRQSSKVEAAGTAEPSEAAIEEKIRQREEARQQKDWAKADQVRNELTGMGVILEDTPQGTRWKRDG